MDSGDIQVSDVAGPARIQTHNKDVTAENIAGQLDIVSSHGDVKVVYANPPAAPLNITNDSGEVDLTLPGRSSFQISAFSRSGEVDSEFEDPSLKTTGEEKDGRLDGQYREQIRSACAKNHDNHELRHDLAAQIFLILRNGRRTQDSLRLLFF